MNTTEVINSVNRKHWDEDYKSAILSDKTLVRKLQRRINEFGLNGQVTITGNGPAGCFAVIPKLQGSYHHNS
jgi:hypothetical protein